MARWRGIGRAFRKGKGGIPAKLEDDELISDNIHVAMMVKKRERIMRPTSGSTFHRFIFENQGDVLNALTRRELQRALSHLRERITLLDVDPSKPSRSMLKVDVAYQTKTETTGEAQYAEAEFGSPDTE